jgi:hypothetical protein
MDLSQLSQLITYLTPIVVPIIIVYVKKLPIPDWMLPTIVAPVLGILAELINQFTTGGGQGVLIGGLLGGVGVWLREIVDQLKKAATTPA